LIEISITILFALTLSISLQGTLWDSQFFEAVLEGWRKYPIVEIEQYDITLTENAIYKDRCKEGWDTVAQGYWWGLQQGCNCNGVL